MLRCLVNCRYKDLIQVRFSNWHHKSTFTSKEVRQSFINFYKDNFKHAFYPSSKVWNADDPTLLFVNAGMNQFKPIFLGQKSLDGQLDIFRRAVNSQRCIRAGGKHNDLNDVGHDLCHHTFFEMLGTWSFGDYFKKETCIMAWKLLTEVYKLDPNRLYVTYFGGCKDSGLKPDIETRNIWKAIGVPDDRILSFGSKENFWEMGDVGPCGPCTEIHYDKVEGDRFVPHLVNQDGSDVVEIWNLVFMQYNRLPCRNLEKLSNHYVDCGMGLERITAILQDKDSNYDTDLFTPIIKSIEKICQCRAYKGKVGSDDVHAIDATYRIISDHARMITVAISDGILPGTQSRHLIVRQVLHRALQSGYDVLNAPPGFLSQLVPVVVQSLEDAIPGLKEKESEVISIVKDAETNYLQTLKICKIIVKQTVEKMSEKDDHFPDDVARRLLYHYGYPMKSLKFEVEKHKKILDERFLTRDHPSNNEDKSRIFKSLERRNFPQTNIITTKLQFNHTGKLELPSTTAEILAFITKSGDVLHEYTTDVSFVLLDKTNIPKINMGTSDNLGFISTKSQELRIKKVVPIKGWILHEIENCEAFFSSQVGCEVQIKPNSDILISHRRAKLMLNLIKKNLKNVIKDPLLLDCRADCDAIKMEISGVLLTEQLPAVEKLITNLISNSDNQFKIDERDDSCRIAIDNFVITSSKVQGKSRTILRCKTGPLALQALKDTAKMESFIEASLQHIKEAHLSNPACDKDDFKSLSVLVHKLNKSTISHVVKLKLKNLIQEAKNDITIKQKRKIKLQ